MSKEHELPSDSDDDDDDYVPGGAESEVGSEIESEGEAESGPDDENDENLKETETRGGKGKGKKRAARGRGTSRKKPKTTSQLPRQKSPEVIEAEKKLSEEEEKKRADSLWADFMKDTPVASKPKSKNSTDATNQTTARIFAPKESATVEKVKITKLFEFAGEEVKVEKEVAADSAEARLSLDSKADFVTSGGSARGRGIRRGVGLGGISSVLGQLGKKAKISTLEKSKLDWDSYKKEENIEEEISTHNKGKDGYLEKQDFLQRADLRQFEIEKKMRSSRRSTSETKCCTKHSRKTKESGKNSAEESYESEPVTSNPCPSHPRTESAGSSSYRPEKLSKINSYPTSGPIRCTCSRRRAKKSKCAAVSPTSFCLSYEKPGEDKERTSGVKNQCCCGESKEKKNLEDGTINGISESAKGPKDSKPPKDPKPCETQGKEIISEREREQLLRPCYCCESGVKPDRKNSSRVSSNLFCCSCFKTLWKKKEKKKKKKKKKKRNGSAAPCNRYLCLHNPERSEYDESVPCVKCTHNCKARYLEANGKRSPSKPCPEAASKTQEIEKSARSIHGSSAPEESDVFENCASTKRKKRCETDGIEGVSEKRSSARKKKREENDKAEKIRKSKRRKTCKTARKPKGPNCCLPNASEPAENERCPCKVPEAEVEAKTKPCMKCPKKMLGESSCKKLTFASCTDLRDYNLRNNNKKKRTSLGVVFDVIFWPYVFWPRRERCK